MLPPNQQHILQPFFTLYQPQLLRLKATSLPTSPASHPNPNHTTSSFTNTSTSQLQTPTTNPEFYPWGQRRIFYHVQFTQKQKEAINAVKSLIIQEEIFKVNEFQEEVILRHLHSTGMDVGKAYDRLKKLCEMFGWKGDNSSESNNSNNNKSYKDKKEKQIHSSPFLNQLSPPNYESLSTRLNQGTIYTLGKSLTGLPIIILQVNLIDTTLPHNQNFSLFYLLIATVLHYRMNPHSQEKYIFLIDLNSLSLSEIPYQYMYKFMELVGVVFGGMCEKILVYRSERIGMLWQIVKRWLPQSTVDKVMFVEKDAMMKQVHGIVSPGQLEQKYGGTLSNTRPGEYWPPRIIHNTTNNASRIVMDLSSLYQQQQDPNSHNNPNNPSQTTQYFSFHSISSLHQSRINQTTTQNQTYKSLGITMKKNIPQKQNQSQQEEYSIEKQQQFFGKITSMCGVKGYMSEKCTYNNNCVIF